MHFAIIAKTLQVVYQYCKFLLIYRSCHGDGLDWAHVIFRRPQCPSNSNAINASVRVGYYNVDGASRGCDSMQPEGIPASVFTHINVGFEYVTDANTITENYGAIVARVSRLKRRYNGLRVNIAIGMLYNKIQAFQGINRMDDSDQCRWF